MMWTTEPVTAVPTAEPNLVGMAIHPESKEADKTTKGLKLHG
ncbi:DUF2000 domain-containing protein [Bosea lathyri]|nr:DUF2000 domain-containing protein [Bosea lathyri]